MKHSSSQLLLVVLASAVGVVGCSTASTQSGTGGHTGTGAGTGGSSGATGGASGGGGSGAPSPAGVLLTPTPTGFVAGAANSLGVMGAWFAYGDGYDAAGTLNGKCQMAGHTAPGACATITAPPIPAGAAGFPPSAAGAMCTTGMVAPVTPMTGTTTPDYSNIFGAGIGLDLNNPGGANAVKGVFPATTKGVTGISFVIDMPPLATLRVEFPTTDTDGTTSGAAYWGGGAAYPPSPVKSGLNVIHWADVKVPGPATTPPVTFDPNKLESIQFHVPTAVMAAAAPYSFCISNMTMLTQ